MKTSQKDLLDLAALINACLKCACGFDIIKSQKEPCACTWTPIFDWFEDRDIDLSMIHAALLKDAPKAEKEIP